MSNLHNFPTKSKLLGCKEIIHESLQDLLSRSAGGSIDVLVPLDLPGYEKVKELQWNIHQLQIIYRQSRGF